MVPPRDAGAPDTLPAVNPHEVGERLRPPASLGVSAGQAASPPQGAASSGSPKPAARGWGTSAVTVPLPDAGSRGGGGRGRGSLRVPQGHPAAPAPPAHASVPQVSDGKGHPGFPPTGHPGEIVWGALGPGDGSGKNSLGAQDAAAATGPPRTRAGRGRGPKPRDPVSRARE